MSPYRIHSFNLTSEVGRIPLQSERASESKQILSLRLKILCIHRIIIGFPLRNRAPANGVLSWVCWECISFLFPQGAFSVLWRFVERQFNCLQIWSLRQQGYKVRKAHEATDNTIMTCRSSPSSTESLSQCIIVMNI